MWLLIHVALVGFTYAVKGVEPSICDALIDPPVLSFEQKPANVLAVMGGETILSCSVYGAPQASISWYHKGKEVTSHYGAALELVIPKRLVGTSLLESKLRIGCVSPATAGEYTCEARTPCGKPIKSSAKVHIEAKVKGVTCSRQRTFSPPIISLLTVNRIELTGNLVQLMCRAEGFPAPSIRWERIMDDESLENIDNKPQYMALSNGDLLLMGDESTVTESFRCTAFNPLGEASAESTVLFTEDE